MSENLIKLKAVASYGGHSITANGSVNLSVVCDYSELVNVIKITQLLNNDVKLGYKVGKSGKPHKLGVFRLKQIVIGGDGESKVKFNGLVDFVEVDELNKLPFNDGESNRFILLMQSEMENGD